MYNLKDFEPYTLRKHFLNATVLVWSRQNGYQFMGLLDRVKAMADNVEFKIVGIEK